MCIVSFASLQRIISCIPVAETVEHCGSNAKVMGLIAKKDMN